MANSLKSRRNMKKQQRISRLLDELSSQIFSDLKKIKSVSEILTKNTKKIQREVINSVKSLKNVGKSKITIEYKIEDIIDNLNDDIQVINEGLQIINNPKEEEILQSLLIIFNESFIKKYPHLSKIINLLKSNYKKINERYLYDSELSDQEIDSDLDDFDIYSDIDIDINIDDDLTDYSDVRFNEFNNIVREQMKITLPSILYKIESEKKKIEKITSNISEINKRIKMQSDILVAEISDKFYPKDEIDPIRQTIKKLAIDLKTQMRNIKYLQRKMQITKNIKNDIDFNVVDYYENDDEEENDDYEFF